MKKPKKPVREAGLLKVKELDLYDIKVSDLLKILKPYADKQYSIIADEDYIDEELFCIVTNKEESDEAYNKRVREWEEQMRIYNTLKIESLKKEIDKLVGEVNSK